ncbi:MAG: Na/Pi cotransporter family protein, partial [Bacteroidales bacterium]|nr:Na/Pi cotransporter family protein [Bacteroidales bacterium]
GAEAVTGEYAEAVNAFFANFNEPSIWNSLLFLFMGTVLTLCVQSSAAIMAITMTLCSTGVLHIDQGIMLVLGENIGTTITSNIVALTANVQARRAAFAHMSINCLGVLWVVILLKPFFAAVCAFVGFDPQMSPSAPDFALKASMTLAAFHSAFNVSNTILLIWFVPYIERFVCWAIKPKKVDEEEDFRLHFITSGIMKTPELSVLEAHKEIESFSERMQRMFGMVRELAAARDGFDDLLQRIEKYEGISDNMENEIGKYLGQVSDAHLSDDTKAKIRAMLREISELESIGDACYNLSRTLNRRRDAAVTFTPVQEEGLKTMFDLVEEALTHMDAILRDREVPMAPSAYLEAELNMTRNALRSQNVADVDNHIYSFSSGAIYMDLVNECEKCGDYVMNVVEARLG